MAVPLRMLAGALATAAAASALAIAPPASGLQYLSFRTAATCRCSTSGLEPCSGCAKKCVPQLSGSCEKRKDCNPCPIFIVRKTGP